eukprot:Pgem_evm1s965
MESKINGNSTEGQFTSVNIELLPPASKSSDINTINTETSKSTDINIINTEASKSLSFSVSTEIKKDITDPQHVIRAPNELIALYCFVFCYM